MGRLQLLEKVPDKLQVHVMYTCHFRIVKKVFGNWLLFFHRVKLKICSFGLSDKVKPQTLFRSPQIILTVDTGLVKDLRTN